MSPNVKREMMSALVCGLLLAACRSTANSQNAPDNQRQLETAACKLISATPILTPTSGSFEAISLPTSTLRALKKTDDRSLQKVVRAYLAAANVQNTAGMIRALNDGVGVCHGLGLKTAT
ncbi:MAG: hypothetical protein ABSE75_10030 [Acidimicrobiales bacterium]|jgi:hypothetical protein